MKIHMARAEFIACIRDELLTMRQDALGIIKNFNRTGHLRIAVLRIITTYRQYNTLVVRRHNNLMGAGTEIKCRLFDLFAN